MCVFANNIHITLGTPMKNMCIYIHKYSVKYRYIMFIIYFTCTFIVSHVHKYA